MSDIAEEYTRNGLDVKIFYDTDPQSPREWDNLGTMICAHRNYNLGDEQANFSDYHSWEHIKQELLIDEREAVLILPLGLYDHSGITMYIGDAHDRWDGGQVGFVYLTKEAFKREQGADPTYNLERAEACIRAEVEEYDKYLRGDVYGFTVTNPKTGEEIDSCWGYFGIEYAKEVANDSADIFKHPHEAAYARQASALHR
jgi:hypothetical protein